MPRIYTSDNDPLDFCKDCYPSEDVAIKLYGNQGDGPDGRGNCFGHDAEHPDYQDEDYKCTTCKIVLDWQDN